MSYTPENEQIEEPAEAMLEALKRLMDVVDRRIYSGNWSGAHKSELHVFRVEARNLEVSLLRLIGRMP